MLRSTKRMASSTSATMPPSKSFRSRTWTLSVPRPSRHVTYASGKKCRTFRAKKSTPALRNSSPFPFRSAASMLTSTSSTGSPAVMFEYRSQVSNFPRSKSSGYRKRGQGERSNRITPSARKKSRISSRPSFCVTAPCRQKKPSPHCTGLASLSRTWTTNTPFTGSASTFTGGSQLRATSWTRARRALESPIPFTEPSSRTPRRTLPPTVFASATISRANDDGERASLNSSVVPSPCWMRISRSAGVVLAMPAGRQPPVFIAMIPSPGCGARRT